MMQFIEYQWYDRHDYENNTLKPNFHQIRESTKFQNYLTAFYGKANITQEGLCDIVDIHGNEPFIDGYMLHFIAEFKDISNLESVLLQRRFITIVRDIIEEKTGKLLKQGGDDLYFDNKKLSVSIIAPTSLNTYIMHAGFNIDNSATLNVQSLNNLFGKELESFEIKNLADNIANKFDQEISSVLIAGFKVKIVDQKGHLANISSYENIKESKPTLYELLKQANQEFQQKKLNLERCKHYLTLINFTFLKRSYYFQVAINSATEKNILAIFEHISQFLLKEN